MRLEPYEGKLSSTVLRGGSGSNAVSLPDYRARLAGIRADGRLDIKTPTATITASHKNFRLIQRNDGFDYATAA